MEEDDGVSAEDITPLPVPRRRPPDPQRLKIENNATLDPAHREFLLGMYDLTAPLAASMQQRADALRPRAKTKPKTKDEELDDRLAKERRRGRWSFLCCPCRTARGCWRQCGPGAGWCCGLLRCGCGCLGFMFEVLIVAVVVVIVMVSVYFLFFR